MATLKQVRKDLGLTQGEIAQKINIPIATLSNCENERTALSLEDMIRLEQFFCQKIDWKENNLDSATKQDIIHSLNSLFKSYPLLPVINFAYKYIRHDFKFGAPLKTVTYFSELSNSITNKGGKNG